MYVCCITKQICFGEERSMRQMYSPMMDWVTESVGFVRCWFSRPGSPRSQAGKNVSFWWHCAMSRLVASAN